MTRGEEAFLALVRAGILGEKPEDPGLEPAAWESLLKQAEAHKLLALVLDTATGLPSLRGIRPDPGAPDDYTIGDAGR